MIVDSAPTLLIALGLIAPGHCWLTGWRQTRGEPPPAGPATTGLRTLVAGFECLATALILVDPVFAAFAAAPAAVMAFSYVAGRLAGRASLLVRRRTPVTLHTADGPVRGRLGPGGAWWPVVAVFVDDGDRPRRRVRIPRSRILRIVDDA